MKFFIGYDLHDLGKTEIPYDELYAKYQDALETIMHYKNLINRLNHELESYEEAYEELSNKYYG